MRPPRCGHLAGWCRRGPSECGPTMCPTAQSGAATSCGLSCWAVSQVWAVLQERSGSGMVATLSTTQPVCRAPTLLCEECVLVGGLCDDVADCTDSSDEEGCRSLPADPGRYSVVIAWLPPGLALEGHPQGRCPGGRGQQLRPWRLFSLLGVCIFLNIAAAPAASITWHLLGIQVLRLRRVEPGVRVASLPGDSNTGTSGEALHGALPLYNHGGQGPS